MTDRTVLVRLRANADQYVREMEKAKAATSGVGTAAKDANRDIDKASQDSARSIRQMGDETDRTSSKFAKFRTEAKSMYRSIDTTNDRMAWMVQGIMAIAPATVPLGASVVPALSALAAGATAAGGAVTALVLAFNGVGDAMGALNDYQLEPTAANLQKLQQAMGDLGPEGQQFVMYLDQIGEQLSVLKEDARAGMFPGMMEGIDSLMTRLPQVRDLMQQMGTTIGDLSAEAGAGLGGEKFDGFFEYLQTDAAPILEDFGRSIGNFAEGFANMMVAMGPLTSDFTGGMLDMSRSFAEWSRTLDSNQSFQDFLDYVQKSGPQAKAFLGALVDLFVELVRAAAPIGSVMLPILTQLVEGLSGLASTPIGHFALLAGALTSMVGRMSALSKLTSGGVLGAFTKNSKAAAASAKDLKTQLTGAAGTIVSTWGTAGTRTERESKRMATATNQAKEAVKGLGKAYAPAANQIGTFALAMSPIPEQLGLSSTAMGAMVGSAFGPWGTAVGAAAGFAIDFATANKDVSDSLEQVRTGLEMGASAEQLQSDMAIARQALSDLKSDIDDVENSNAFPGINAMLRQHKNEIEGWFGKSDVEEADEALAKYERQVAEVAQAEKEAKIASMEASDGLQTLGRSAGMSDDEILKNANALQQVSTQAGTASTMFVDLTGAVNGNKVSFDGWINSMQKQAEATRNLRQNVGQLLQKGLNPQLIQDLVDQGQEGAVVLDRIANGGKGAVKQANQAFANLQRELGLTDQQMRDLGLTAAGIKIAPKVDGSGLKTGREQVQALADQLRNVPKSVVTQLKADPGNSDAIIKNALRNLDLTKKERRALITIRDMATPTTKQIRRALDIIAGKKVKPKVEVDTKGAKRNLRGLDTALSVTGKKKPKVKVDANTKPANQKLTGLDRALAITSKKKPKIKVDANTKGAQANLDKVGRKADSTGKKKPKVEVTANTKGAQSDLDQVGRKADSTGKKKPTVTVDGKDNASKELAQVTTRANALDKVDPSVTISAVDNASGKISSVSSSLANLNGNEAVTYITTVKRTRKGNADGGTIERDSFDRLATFAAGGSVRGTVPGPRMPYGDKVDAKLAPGEEVITNRNGEADRNRAELKAANAGAKLAVIGWAGGGTVGDDDEEDEDDWDEDDWFASFARGGTARRRKKRRKKGKRGKKRFTPKTPKLDKAIDNTSDRLTKLGKSLDSSQKTLDAETNARNTLVSSVKSALDADIWAAPEAKSGTQTWNSKWAGGAAPVPEASVKTVSAALRQQRAEAQEFDRIMQGLRRRGLNGRAYEEIAEGGIERARLFKNQNRAQLNAYEKLYNSTQAAVSTAASHVGDTAATVAQLRGLRNQVTNLTKAINKNERRKEKLTNQREKAREKQRKQHAKRTGKAAGDAVKSSAKKGRRNRR